LHQTADPWFVTAIETLNDLTNYIGVGVVTLMLSEMAGPGPEAPDGWHWLEIPTRKPRRIEGAAYDLYMLATLHLLRCTYKMLAALAPTSTSTAAAQRPAGRPSNAIVRVYCLPVDVGQGLVSRKNRNIRKYMRSVMEEVDVSRELWEGEVPHDRRAAKIPLLSQVSRLAPTPGLAARLTTMVAPSGEVYYLDRKAWEVFEQPSYENDTGGTAPKKPDEADTTMARQEAAFVEGLNAAGSSTQMSEPANTPNAGTKRTAAVDGDDMGMEDSPKRAKTVESS
jgi:hypothetical protein